MFFAGNFLGRDAAVRALIDLKARGFTPDNIALFSDEPIEVPRGVLDRNSHMSLAAVIGAITSFVLVVGFVYYTQHDYPIVTGGMPIFSFWATGVVFYELTMLGAIVTTFFWFLRESGLLSGVRRRAPAPRVEPGVICLRVECKPDQADAIRHSLRAAGAEDVRVIGDAR